MHIIRESEWEKAFVAYGFDAATGRLFRGLAHNSNGVAQAFSMQTELLQMMFAQADGLFSQIENAASLNEAREVGRKLKVLLERRASLVVHLEREVQVIQQIMHRCSGLVAATGESAAALPPFSLRTVVETELEFMNGDGFFKHKVKKELTLPTDLPSLQVGLVEIHLIIATLLENAAQSMQVTFAAGQTEPGLAISASASGKQIFLAVSDNGEGIDIASQARIFEPFFTTRPERLGIGLWLARRLAERFGGSINCESVVGCTTFTLVIPCQGDADAGC